MKKIMFFITVTFCINLFLCAQGTSYVAGRFHSLAITFYLQDAMEVTKGIHPIATGFISAQLDSNELAIRDIISTMQRGWNEKSGKTFASGFYKVHDYIVINGLYLSGITREMNEQSHQGIFNSIYKTTDLELRLDKISFVRPDLALVYALGATYEHGSPVPENPMAIISMLIEKNNNEWKIISFHNCNIEVSFDPAAQKQSPIPLKVMYASWYKK